ncbi:hypothetical protein L873DRAFT_1884181, partial [Choiromyces venosus 120613-1]
MKLILGPILRLIYIKHLIRVIFFHSVKRHDGQHLQRLISSQYLLLLVFTLTIEPKFSRFCKKITLSSPDLIQFNPASSMQTLYSSNLSSLIAAIMAPTNTKQVFQLKNLLKSSNNIEDIKKIRLVLGTVAGSIMAATAIVQEIVRQVAAV